MTLELPDPLRRPPQASVDQGLTATSTCDAPLRSSAALPRIEAPLPLRAHSMSNAGLFALLED